MSGNDTIPAGWYPDPEQIGQLRFWDGHSWTDQRQATAPPPSPGVGVPPSPYPPVRGDRTNAGVALGLSIAGLIACGILSPIGMIMGRNEVQRIDSGQGDPGARGMAQAAWIVGLVGTIILVVGVLLVILVLGVFASTA